MNLKTTMNPTFPLFDRQKGLSLIELMVAMVLSIIVVGAIVALMSNSLGASKTTIQSTRLVQEMRDGMQIMTRDLRRAGFDADAYDAINPGTNSFAYNNFSDITITPDTNPDPDNQFECILFSVDRSNAGAPTAGDQTGFRVAQVNGVGVLQVKVNNAGACNDAADSANWPAITDVESVNITRLSFDDSESFTSLVRTRDTDNDGTPDVQDELTTRKIKVVLEGQLLRDATIARRFEDEVKIRNPIYLVDQPYTAP